MAVTLKDQLDFFVLFKEWYYQIIANFKFDYRKDCEARDYLSGILTKKVNDWQLEEVLFSFKKLIQSRSNIFIFGCGPSLEDTVNFVLNYSRKEFFNDSINLAADGASVLLGAKGIHIHGIFTDLDGITKKQFNRSDFMIVHAHGDNIDKLKYFEKYILNHKNIIGTTQVEPSENLVNPGGFTDGDRILFFLRTLLLAKHKLFLIGMDFDSVVGKYSKPKMDTNRDADPIKKAKLKYAVRLIKWFITINNNPIYFVNSKIASKRFTYISIEELEKKLQPDSL